MFIFKWAPFFFIFYQQTYYLKLFMCCGHDISIQMETLDLP